jgi:hypothetical protein
MQATADIPQLSWRPTLIALAVLSLLIVASGVLTNAGILPIAADTNPLPQDELWFQLYFIGFGVLIGLVLPVLVLASGRQYAAIRAAYGPYVLVLLVQLVSEALFSALFFQAILAITGIVYTAYRLWQVWQGIGLLRADSSVPQPLRKRALGLLWLLLPAWAFNLVGVLLIYSLPLIIEA